MASLIAPRGEWKRFRDATEKESYFRLWGLTISAAKGDRPVMYNGIAVQTPTPCDVVGYRVDNWALENKWAIIELDGKLGCIHGEYLAEMQPTVQTERKSDKHG